VDIRAATEIVRKKRPDLKIEGPIQYDAAVDMEVGQSKMPIQRQDRQVCLFFLI
jgi:phosphotransacetylase